MHPIPKGPANAVIKFNTFQGRGFAEVGEETYRWASFSVQTRPDEMMATKAPMHSLLVNRADRPYEAVEGETGHSTGGKSRTQTIV